MAHWKSKHLGEDLGGTETSPATSRINAGNPPPRLIAVHLHFRKLMPTLQPALWGLGPAKRAVIMHCSAEIFEGIAQQQEDPKSQGFSNFCKD